MSDIVEIALDYFTDYRKFEDMATQLMLLAGFRDIKPLGGGGDRGRDAVAEPLFASDSNRNRIVFQFSLDEDPPSKIVRTAKRLREEGIRYFELVYVTHRRITATQQDRLKATLRQNYDAQLEVFDRKYIASRLGEYDNGIFHRFFPSIEQQIQSLLARRPILSRDAEQERELALLRASISLCIDPSSHRTRNAIFDQLVIAVLINTQNNRSPITALEPEFRKWFPGLPYREAQTMAAIRRLQRRNLLNIEANNIIATKNAIGSYTADTIRINVDTDALITEIAERTADISGRTVSDALMGHMRSNTRNVLTEFFRLHGREYMNQTSPQYQPGPVYLEQREQLVQTARSGLPDYLGEILIATIAETLERPNEEQATILTSWSMAYIGCAVMNLDPSLRDFQATRLASKTFILDTDFVLDCLVVERPESRVFRQLLKSLRAIGCRIVIPRSCLNECMIHAENAFRTFNHFGASLLGLTDSMVEEKVWNVFVKGYYYACRGLRGTARSLEFNDYIQNYYEPSSPEPFMREIISEVFPDSVEIVEVRDLLVGVKIPEPEMLRMTDELYVLVMASKKAEYRSRDENREIAKLDAELFLAVQHLNGEVNDPSGALLGGQYYLITSSGRYLRCAKKVEIRDVVSTRPQSIAALLEIIGHFDVRPGDYAMLFENPLMVYAVNKCYDDVVVLLRSGIRLQGKSLPRLRWDLDNVLHERLAASEAADQESEIDSEAGLESCDEKFIELLRQAKANGYELIPEAEEVLARVRGLEADLQASTEALTVLEQQNLELSAKIEHFGRRKQRYLRRFAQGKKGD